MNNSIALPRLRSKRKKRKPPRPQFYRALMAVLWDSFFGLLDTFFMVNHINNNEPVFAAIMGIFAALMFGLLVNTDWPRFRRELKLWRKDDEE